MLVDYMSFHQLKPLDNLVQVTLRKKLYSLLDSREHRSDVSSHIASFVCLLSAAGSFVVAHCTITSEAPSLQSLLQLAMISIVYVWPDKLVSLRKILCCTDNDEVPKKATLTIGHTTVIDMSSCYPQTACFMIRVVLQNRFGSQMIMKLFAVRCRTIETVQGDNLCYFKTSRYCN